MKDWSRLIKLMMLIVVLACALSATAQRHITPVTPPDPFARPVEKKDVKPDASRLKETIDANGNVVMVDTVTGREWVDSTAMKLPPMIYPLLHNISFGVNVWDGVMRAFGQKYGIGDVEVSVSLHNRYILAAEFGLGICNDTPVSGNYTYKTPLAPYFKIGADYNFFYNSSPDYVLAAGLRYCLTPFGFEIDNAQLDNSYWDEAIAFDIPRRNVFVGYLEIGLRLRVKIAGPVSLGWAFKYHKLLHESDCSESGEPMYIPGMGKRNSSIAGAFTVYYTLNFNKK